MSFADIPPETDLCQLPSGPAPDGETVDFTQTDLKDLGVGVTTTLTVITTIFVASRLYSNFRRLGWSDLMVFVALGANIATQVTLTMNARLFRHAWHLPLCWISGEYQKLVYIWTVLYIVSGCFSKIATLVLFLEVFTVSRGMRKAIWTGIGVTVVLYGASLILSSYFLVPHNEQTWESLILYESIEVVSFSAYWVVVSGSAILLIDLYILILPLPVLWRLNLSKRRKMLVTAVFLVGGLAVAASTVSLVFKALYIDVNVQTHDYTYDSAVVENLLLVEMDASLIIPCTIAFASVVRSHIPQTRVYVALRSAILGDECKESSNNVHNNPNQPRTGREKRPGQNDTRHKDGYIEMNDTWPARNNATVDIEVAGTAVATNDSDGQLEGLVVTKMVHVERNPPPSLSST
ncbi:hypothetical protein F4803DRAFT_407961 [Xylaria telfairii]|nr:hypothetical protein F4803DRAFT_407961 [Xylaria telfairii]